MQLSLGERKEFKNYLVTKDSETHTNGRESGSSPTVLDGGNLSTNKNQPENEISAQPSGIEQEDSPHVPRTSSSLSFPSFVLDYMLACSCVFFGSGQSRAK